jgi:hypothetical protein
MTLETKIVVLRCLSQDLTNAVDNRMRAEMQQKRMPFDHDNNNSLDRYIKWEREVMKAIIEVQS